MKRCTLTFTPDTHQTAAATTSTTAEFVAGNVDLLLQVLLRLPLKSIVKFEAVSKHWRSILRGHYFSHRRFPDTTAPSGLLVHEVPLNYAATAAIEARVSFVPIIDQEEEQRPPYNSTPPPPVSSLTFVSPDPDYRISIIDSCNGLLICCDDSKSRKYNRYPPRKYFVLNPTTKRFRMILNCREDDETNNYKPKKEILGMALAYDPVCLLNYKVVCLVDSDVRPPPNIKVTSPPFRIMIYSSVTRAWRCSGDPFCFPGVDFSKNGVFLNGAVYWVGHDGSSLYFHLDTESLKTLAMPIEDMSSTIWYFGKQGNVLQLIYLERGRGILRGYEMEAAHSISDYSYPAGWLFKFQMSSGISKYIHFDIHSMFWEEDDPLVVEDQEQNKKKKKPFLVIRINRMIIRLNLMDSTSEKIFDIPKIFEDVITRHEVFPYFESLACV